MTLSQNEMCLADAVEDWWDTNIEKIKKKLGRKRWIDEFECAIHSNSDYLQKAVSNALTTKKYNWDTYDIINQNTQDDIAEVLANLAYQDLFSDDEWCDTRFDSFEEYSNGGNNMDRKKLEARIAKLEKALKNEGFDISADVYNWFNKYCNDILDKDKRFGWKDLQEDLEDTDASIYTDECLLDLAAEYGIDPDDLEEYRDQVEYDIEKLVKDALEYIEYGYDDGMTKFDKNTADWMDRYRDNDAYTASLESRINKLEKKLKSESFKKIFLENLMLSTFDCNQLSALVNKELPDCDIDFVDDNADNGFVNIAIYNPEYIADYDVIANDIDSFEVANDDKTVGIAKSFKEVAKMIATHFKKNYI